MKHARKSQQRAFTLVEILVTITLVSILLAIAVPQYNAYIARGQVAEAFTIARGLQDEIIDAYSVTENLPLVLSDITTLTAADFAGRYTSQVSLDAGSIVATMGGDARASLQGATLVLVPYLSGAGDVFFFCDTASIPGSLTPQSTPVSTTTIPNEALPADCRT
jgi:type IV pilus assembly protein PilA